MAYQIIILPSAEKDFDKISPPIRDLVVKRLMWLAENGDEVIHHALKGMPEDLSGLCRFRVGDYRILYWKYPSHKLLKIYRVLHRSTVYKGL